MKSLFFILFSCCNVFLWAQAVSKNTDQQLEGSVAPMIANNSKLAENQLRYWESQINLDSTNADAWLNYYIWTDRNNNIRSNQHTDNLQILVNSAAEKVKNKAAYYLMIYLHSGKKDSTALYNAFRLTENKTQVYPYLLQYYIITYQQSVVKEHCIEYNRLNPMPDALYHYHYNVLMSADSNAQIFAKGINDLVPLLILQQVHDVRKDIQLQYYTTNSFIKEGDYFCLSIGKEIIKQYPNTHYTGLLVKYASKNTLKELQTNIEKKWQFDYINDLSNSEQNEILQIHKNYLPSLVLLYQYYVKTNHSSQKKLHKKIAKISEMAGVESVINQSIQE